MRLPAWLARIDLDLKPTSSRESPSSKSSKPLEAPSRCPLLAVRPSRIGLALLGWLAHPTGRVRVHGDLSPATWLAAPRPRL